MMFKIGPVFVFLSSSIFLLLVFHIWNNRRYYYLGFKIPGPPFLTNLRYVTKVLGSLEITTRNILQYYREECSTFNYAFAKVWFGPKLFIFLADPNIVHETFRDHLLKDTSMYRFINPFTCGNSIFQENQLEKWKSHRKIIAGASLNFTSLKSFVEIFFQESLILGDKLSALAKSKQAFEPLHKMTLASFAMILRTMCGLDMGIQSDQNGHPFVEVAEKAFRNVGYRFFKPWLFSDTLYALLEDKKKEIEDYKVSRGFVEKIIAKIKTDIIEETNPIDDQKSLVENSDQKKSLQNFIQVIIREQLDPNIPSQNVMSHADLVSEMLFMLSAGFDTTKTANTIILTMLALHPKVQQNVFNEIHTVLGADLNIAPTYNQLQEMDLLTRVIKETLRLFPTAPAIGRQAEQEIDVGGYTVPRGTSVWTLIIGIHHDPRYWTNPNQFDPDRFLPSEMAKQHPKAYMPFSTGPRNCIGGKYAMLQMKTTISTILRRYRVLPGDKCKSMDDIRFEFGMTMVLLPGCDIRLESRV